MKSITRQSLWHYPESTLLIVLTGLDAIFTIFLIEDWCYHTLNWNDITEVNPWLIGVYRLSPIAFIAVKLTLVFFLVSILTRYRTVLRKNLSLLMAVRGMIGVYCVVVTLQAYFSATFLLSRFLSHP